MAKPTIYDLLAKQGIDEITIAQLNTATSNSAVDEASIDFWKGPIVLQRVLQMRTYPHGLAIPEKSVTVTSLLPPGENYDIQPNGSELWQLIAIQALAAVGTPEITINTYDGAEAVLMHRGTAIPARGNFFPWESPIPLTNTGYVRISNEDLSNAMQISFSYHTVGL